MVSETAAPISTAAYLADWLAHVRTRVRPTTYRGYEAIVRLYLAPGIGQVPLGELSPLGLQRLYSGAA